MNRRIKATRKLWLHHLPNGAVVGWWDKQMILFAPKGRVWLYRSSAIAIPWIRGRPNKWLRGYTDGLKMWELQ